MNCPYKDSLVPPCDVVPHRTRQNIEYCRVCEQWRDINTIGYEFPNFFWFLLAIGIVWLILQSAEQPDFSAPPPAAPQPNYLYPSPNSCGLHQCHNYSS